MISPDDHLVLNTHGFASEATSFIGRRREVAAIKSRLSGSRIVTLTGFGGVGKSRLACRVATEVRRSYADGVWFVDLSTISNPELVAAAIFEALDIRDGSMLRRPYSPFDSLNARHALVLLDNCEHLIEACGKVVAEIVRRSSGVQILATSREPLGVLGEAVFEVPPLSVPNEAQQAEGTEGREFHSEAVDLFEQRAASVIPEYALDAETRLAVARLCRRLDGIPLAIELAAVRIRSLPLDHILSLERPLFDFLTRGNRGAPVRHQTLRGAIDWSFDLCSPDERALWTRLSVFSGGFDFDAAESVCTDPETVTDVFEVISSLVEKSIVSTVHSGSTVRYKLLESIKDYAAEKLVEQGDDDTWRRKHRDYFLHLSELSESQSLGSGQLQWNRRLQYERANLRAALEYSLSTRGEARIGLRMASSLWFFWNASGLLQDGRYWLTRSLEADHQPSSDRAKALWVIGWYALVQGENAIARQYLLECNAVAEQIGDRTAQAFGLQFRGTVEQIDGNLDIALELLNAAMSHHSKSEKVNSLTLLCGAQLAFVYCLSGNLEQSVVTTTEAIALGKSLKELFATSWALWTRGLALWTQREFTGATDSLKESIELKQSLSDWLGVAACTEILAWIAIEEGDAVRSARLLGIGRTLCGEMGSSPLFGSDALVRTRTRYEQRARQLLGSIEFTKESAAGERLQHHESIEFALQKHQPEMKSSSKHVAIEVKLTPREKEVAKQVAEGFTNREIAERLVISRRTVEGHVDRILAKTGHRSRSQLAAWIARDTSVD